MAVSRAISGRELFGGNGQGARRDARPLAFDGLSQSVREPRAHLVTTSQSRAEYCFGEDSTVICTIVFPGEADLGTTQDLANVLEEPTFPRMIAGLALLYRMAMVTRDPLAAVTASLADLPRATCAGESWTERTSVGPATVGASVGTGVGGGGGPSHWRQGGGGGGGGGTADEA